ncbi:MAG: sugar phosphate isomerase/epimerase [Fimbriimonas sp.]|nr:sugar phosphate isomerase/epimerase [Fimbriimonas sp.]
MKLSIQCYTVRQAMERDVWGTFRSLKAMGLNYVEIGGSYGPTPKELKNGLDDIGMGISACHVGMSELESQFDKIVEDNLLYGSGCIVLASVGRAKYSQGWQVVAKELEEYGARFKEVGFKFAYHNHSFEFQLQDGKPGLDILYDSSDPSLLMAQIDTYWVAYGNADPAAYLRKLRGRVPYIHVKDGKLGGDEPRFLEVGNGDLNWDDILAACKESGVEFAAIEQDLCERPELESAKISVDFLRSKGVVD